MGKRAAAIVISLSLLAACRSVGVQSAVSWREAVAAAKEQSDATFEAVGKVVRESQIERIERQPPKTIPTLQESDFAPGLPAEGLRRWNLAFDQLAAYASAMESLLSADLPPDVGDALKTTGEEIGAVARIDLLRKDQKLSSTIGELGRQIVAEAAQREARTIMLAVDPTIRALTRHMADMLYETRPGTDENGTPVTKEYGILPTLRVTWNDRLAFVQEDFRKTTAKTTRKKLAKKFADLLDEREASLESIRSLRRTILDLATAHTAAAQGRSRDLTALVATITADVKQVRDLVGSIEAREREET